MAPSKQHAFTFIEVMIAVVIVGVGVVALMHAMTVATAANQNVVRADVALGLARNVHEYVMAHDIPAVDALDSATAGPVIDSNGKAIAGGYTDWQQLIRVYKVVPTSGIQANVALTNGSTTRLRRVAVQVLYKGKPEYSQSWLVSPSGL